MTNCKEEDEVVLGIVGRDNADNAGDQTKPTKLSVVFAMPGGKKSHKLETSWKGFFFALRTRDAFFYCCLFNGGRSCTCSL